MSTNEQCCHCGCTSNLKTYTLRVPVTAGCETPDFKYHYLEFPVCDACKTTVFERYPAVCKRCKEPKTTISTKIVKSYFLAPPCMMEICDDCATKLHTPNKGFYEH